MSKGTPCSAPIGPEALGFPDEAIRLCRDAQFRAIFKMVERRMANRDAAYRDAWNEYAEKVTPSREEARKQIEELSNV